jgi:hypothetical protein
MVGDAVLDNISTWNNASQALFWMEQQAIITKNGIKLDELKSNAPAYAKFVGFTPNVVPEYYKGIKWEQDIKQYMKDKKSLYIKLHRQFADTDGMDSVVEGVVFGSEYGPEEERIRKNAQKELMGDKTMVDKLRRTIEKRLDEGRTYRRMLENE